MVIIGRCCVCLVDSLVLLLPLQHDTLIGVLLHSYKSVQYATIYVEIKLLGKTWMKYRSTSATMYIQCTPHVQKMYSVDQFAHRLRAGQPA